VLKPPPSGDDRYYSKWVTNGSVSNGGPGGAPWQLGILYFLVLTALVAAGLTAWHNGEVGRSDRRGAGGLCAFMFIVGVLQWAVSVNHVASAAELGLFFEALSSIAFVTLMVLLLYVAVEPYVRETGLNRSSRGRDFMVVSFATRSSPPTSWLVWPPICFRTTRAARCERDADVASERGSPVWRGIDVR
jgi:hypothetical protein